MTPPPRVVYDCNTLLQALASPDGPAGRAVQLALDGDVQLFVSPGVLAELSDVASRPRVVAKLKLVVERVEDFFTALGAAAVLLDGFPEPFVYERDPDDALYVNLALAADATLIVSRDRDLLDLMDAAKPEADAFQARFPALRILDPIQFLREVASRREP
jgi:putative PIN family toxin of toxin-antitoxin system